MGWWWRNGQHNGWKLIAVNSEAEQWEAMQDGQIAMDCTSGNRQWWHNGQRDGKAIVMGNGTAVA